MTARTTRTPNPERIIDMLPYVTLNHLRTGAIASVTALSMALASATPSHALDKKERTLLGLLAAAAIVGVIANDAARKKREQQSYYEEPRYTTPDPQYHNPRYDEPRYNDPRYEEPRYQPQPSYGNATGAFTEFSPASRRAIQSRLRAYGYYTGPIDGAYGPGTRRAIEAYARDTGNASLLGSRNGTVTLLNGLLA
jgi:Putative peptidoglycan binding domain